MEQYLIDDYNVEEDENYLKSEEDIPKYFRDSYDDFKCGLGFYEEEKEFICKIKNKYYIVNVRADIGSAKQDRGERLYWVENISANDITYEEIPKPEPKEKFRVDGVFVVTEDQYRKLWDFLRDNKIDVDELEKVE